MIVYLSTASSYEYQKKCDGRYATQPMVYVQQRWDYTMCKGFISCLGEDFAAVSYPPIQTFPSGRCIIKKREREKAEGFNVNYCGFINLPVIKQITAARSAAKIIKKMMKERGEDELTIITHSFYPTSFSAIKKLKRRFKVKVYTIIPDLPDFAYSNLNRKNKLLAMMWKRFNNMKQKLKAVPDGYVCFSEHQRNYLDREKPYVVMEGFADVDYIDSVPSASLDPDKKILVYAGALKKAYGVDALVDAFKETSDKSSELWLYGDGESKEYVTSSGDERIKYKGCVSRDEVVAIEKSAYALINPRPSEEEYAKCSFPSKLLEYMASGTPILTTRLESMPEDYLDKLIFIEEASKDGIKLALEALLGGSSRDIKDLGARAEEFVRNQKNPTAQAKKILQFIKEQNT